MGYVAGKSIKVMRGGEAVQLKPGDPVPEAATWRNLKKELAWGRVKEVPDGKAEAVATPPPPAIEELPKEEKPKTEKAKAEKPKKSKRGKKDKAPWEE